MQNYAIWDILAYFDTYNSRSKNMILVTGASGFVGHKIMEMCRDVIAAPSLRGMSEDDIKHLVCESDADAIIHTAAKGGDGK